MPGRHEGARFGERDGAADRLTESARQSAEDGPSRRHADQLPDDGSESGLKRGRERGNPEPGPPGNQRAQNRVGSGHGQERGEVGCGPQEATEDGCQVSARWFDRPAIAAGAKSQGDDGWFGVDREYPTILVLIDLLDSIDRPGPQEGDRPAQLEVRGWVNRGS